MSRLCWYPDPSSIVGGKAWTARVSDDVRLFIRPSNVSNDRWCLFKTTPDEPLSVLKTFPSRESAELWAESEECFKEAKNWMKRVDQYKRKRQEADALQAKVATVNLVPPEQRIVAGYKVCFRDGTSIFCVGSLQVIKSQLGTEWSSILPVLAYQYGAIEDLGQIIDQKA